MTTSNLDLVGAFYAALARGDVPALVCLLHPDLEWTEAEGFPYFGGTWRTAEDVVEKLLIPIGHDWHDFAAVATDFVAEGDRVVSLGTYSGVNVRTGKPLRASFAHVWRIRDGKLQRFQMYTDTLLVDRAMRP